MKLIAMVFALISKPAWAQVTVDTPWARATAPGAKVAAGDMTIRNGGAADRMVGASSSAAERVEMHITQRDGDIARMRQVKAYDIPPKGAFELKPGGAHLMFINVKAPFKQGEKIPVVLRFERAGEVKAELEVRGLGAGSHASH